MPVASVQRAQRLTSPLLKEVALPDPPLEVFARMAERPYACFLDSGMDPAKLGRYSFLASDPFLVLRSSRGNSVVECQGERTPLTGNPFTLLRELLSRHRLDPIPGAPPFLVGGIGYLSYDLCHFVERLPASTIDDLALPDCYWAFFDRSIVFDHATGKAFLAATGAPDEHGAFDPERASRALRELEALVTRRAAALPLHDVVEAFDAPSLRCNFTREAYLRAVREAKAYIAAGDIFQVNLSQRFDAAARISPFALYRRLRALNPAPFAAYLGFGDVSVLSASPERFLRLAFGRVETRPIKGTRPRGGTEERDRLLAAELLASAKDRAEHVMIVDLERNDLGRVCDYGSVTVPELWALESYATVHHLVSTVEGRLHADRDRIDLLKACFPGGSITGAPKVRAMEIIDELEPTARGVYTGSVGYLGFTGDMDLNIVIRTFVVAKGRAYFQVGGGIVADSEPADEYRETLDKARALLQAINAQDVAGVTREE